MPLYMLDTDMVSYLVRGKTPALDAHVATASKKHLRISAVTRGELLYGLKLKDGAHRLAQLVDQFLLRVQCLPWARSRTGPKNIDVNSDSWRQPTCLEFGDHFARCDAASGNPEPGLERDLQAVGQEGNENMGFDAWLDAMVDGSDAQIVL